MARDPICGMEVAESQAAASLEYKGQGWWARFLNRLAQANRETYGGKPPKCH